MTYETYKKKLSQKQYFEKWEDDKLQSLTEYLKSKIYKKYIVKCDVFQRDEFICQAKGCNSTDELTMHHVKWQKNGGEDKVNNCITLCHKCHKIFHSGKKPLIVKNNKKLPANIRGKTFKLDKLNEINWKQIKKEMKRFRKTIHDESGLTISWKQVSFLMKWLEMIYKE